MKCPFGFRPIFRAFAVSFGEGIHQLSSSADSPELENNSKSLQNLVVAFLSLANLSPNLEFAKAF